MGAIRRKSFEDPDGLRELPLLTVSLARIGSHTIGRGVVQPGWHWSEHLAPVMRTESCPVHHVQVLLSGHFAVRMDDGEEVAFQPGDVMDIPPGHDAWVVGDEPAVLIDFAGNIDLLGLPREHERMVTTLLMTDIVDSTRSPTAWVTPPGSRCFRSLPAGPRPAHPLRRIRGQYHRRRLPRHLPERGRRAPMRAAILDALRDTGIEVRIGVHTGEVEPIGNNIGGVAVHAAARIMALAGPSEVFASAMTVGLAEGSGLAFESQGAREVKGLERPIEVYRLI